MNRTAYAFFGLAALVFVAGMLTLANREVSSGAAYPQYSSLRTDPDGTKLLYETSADGSTWSQVEAEDAKLSETLNAGVLAINTTTRAFAPLLEGLTISAIETAMDLLLGLASCSFIEKFGLQLDPDVYYISNLPVNVDADQFITVAAISLWLSYLATLYPTTKASRLSPVDGLREE